MSADRSSILFVGAERELEGSLREAVRPPVYVLETIAEAGEALARLQAAPGEVALVILEVVPPDEAGIETLRRIRRLDPDLPVILTSSGPAPGLIVTALKSGAADFLCEPISVEDWQNAIAAALNPPRLQRSGESKTASLTGAFVGNSASMGAIQTALQQIAWADVPVLIQGETGAGKEVLARELHANSQRAKKPFFKLNCAALPSELVESELFGYERGAFTGAFQRKPGIFEAADGGTILLDEIGDMDVRLQAKLLQVLQDQAFQRIGGKEPIKVDVRVIAATHCDLEKNIQDGSFREDLYYRLNVVNLVVPPLRDRKEDIFHLADVLLRKHAKAEAIPELTPELRNTMLAWHWPGNVRELENFARKLLIFRDCAYLARELKQRMRRAQVTPTPGTQGAASVRDGYAAKMAAEPPAEYGHIPLLAEVNSARQKAEAAAILAALNAAHWNRRTAAALLNTDYKALLYRMKKLGIDQKRPVEVERSAAAPMAEAVQHMKAAAAV
jgi:two-component system, NtrC family, response regulator AtoC